MAYQNFQTIPQTNILSSNDKLLIGKTNSDYSVDIKTLIQTFNYGNSLLIYYSTPLAINGAWTVEKASIEYSFYDYVVFGNGLEQTNNAEHTNLVNVLAELKKIKPTMRTFGYIDCGVTTSNLTIDAIKAKIDAWKTTGITDIFLDDLGYDFQVPRSRQNEIISYVHNQGMFAFINAWNPDDVFSSSIDATYNNSGIATVASYGDFYLSESFLYCGKDSSPYASNNNFITLSNFKTKEDKVIAYEKSLGIIPCACDLISPTYSTSIDYNKLINYTITAALTMGKKVYGVQLADYSASTAQTSEYFLENNSVTYDFYNFKEFSQKLFTTNINYYIDNDWKTFTRMQSGMTTEFFLKDNYMLGVIDSSNTSIYYSCKNKYSIPGHSTNVSV